MPLLLGRVRGNSAAGSWRQGAEFPAQKSGRSTPELQARTNGRYGKIELDPI